MNLRPCMPHAREVRLFRNGRNQAARVREHGPLGLSASEIVAAEPRLGAVRKRSPRLGKRIEEFLQLVAVQSFVSPAGEAYAAIRAELEAEGKPIGPNNLFIAAHARALVATLVTANIGEFRRVRGLKGENWLD